MASTSQQQVSNTPTNIQNFRIRSAIDILLSSDSVEVTEPSLQLTECSPEVDIIMNKQGGICTRCHTMFKSRSALMSHLNRCVEYDNNDISENQIHNTNIEKSQMVLQQVSSPRLIIVPH